MTIPFSPLAVQIWAPGLDVSHLIAGLEQASVQAVDCAPSANVSDEIPLLVIYTDPLGLCQQQQIEQALSHALGLRDSIQDLLIKCRHCRLVNMACLSIPDLVAWCVEPAVSPSIHAAHPFPHPDPLSALLALDLLRRNPALADTYLALETHELAALRDQRPIDSDFENRYLEACSWQSLLDARMEQACLYQEISSLAQQVEPLRFNQEQTRGLQEQIQALNGKIEHAEVLAQRCSDLEISLQAQQQEMEVLARRLALLESLLIRASASSTAIQLRLSQILGP